MDANRFNQVVLSMLIYPVPNDTDREVKMQLSKDEENQLLIFRITNSPLVDPAFASQQVSIRLKINQLLFEHFGGSFMVSESAENGYPITFSIATLWWILFKIKSEYNHSGSNFVDWLRELQ